MISIDFLYWLQGYFELSKAQPTITFKQKEVIQRHLNMVHITDGLQKHPFCSWLQGTFDTLDAITTGTEQKDVPSAVVALINEKLYTIFDHVVARTIEQTTAIEKSNSIESSEDSPERIFIDVDRIPRMMLDPSEVSEMIRC